MTPRERAASYSTTFPSLPRLASTDRWVYGVWAFGNNYKATGSLYGAYPQSYLKRVRSLYPDLIGTKTLHLFKGTVAVDGEIPGIGIDINPAMQPSVVGDAEKLPFKDGAFDWIVGDPPYGKEHAKRYGYKMIDRRKVLREVARVTKIGGHLVWLDTVRPMFRKLDWHEYGMIGCVRSTNHVVRMAFLYERAA